MFGLQLFHRLGRRAPRCHMIGMVREPALWPEGHDEIDLPFDHLRSDARDIVVEAGSLQAAIRIVPDEVIGHAKQVRILQRLGFAYRAEVFDPAEFLEALFAPGD